MVGKDSARSACPRIFTAVADLARKIRKYIRAYAKVARPFRWSYSDPTRRIIANPMRHARLAPDSLRGKQRTTTELVISV